MSERNTSIEHIGEKPTFKILIAPPNVTGKIHYGHLVELLVNDIYANLNKQNGVAVSWPMCLDHAGIATESKVKSIYGSVNQENLLQFTASNRSAITSTIGKLALSIDLQDSHYTLDEDFQQISLSVIKLLVERKLVYFGNYMINWCTQCKTTISDEEVEHNEVVQSIYFVPYQASDGSDLIVATTRPETIPFDAAVALNSDSSIAYVTNPFTSRRIPVVKNCAEVKQQYTRTLKLTPTCSKVDKNICEKYSISFQKKSWIDENGCVSGVPLEEFRKHVLERIDVLKVDEVTSSVPQCYRCKTRVEQRFQQEFFINTSQLAKQYSQRIGAELNIIPESSKTIIMEWLKNTENWCISRDLQNGIRVPLCICNGRCVADTDCNRCHQKTLDTWFTSSLWNVVSREVDILVVGIDILGFWVVKMLLMSLLVYDKVNIKTILSHGIIYDKLGRKLSKSLGNYEDLDKLIASENLTELKLKVLSNINLKDSISMDITGGLAQKVAEHVRRLESYTQGEIPAGEIRSEIGLDFMKLTYFTYQSFRDYASIGNIKGMIERLDELMCEFFDLTLVRMPSEEKLAIKNVILDLVSLIAPSSTFQFKPRIASLNQPDSLDMKSYFASKFLVRLNQDSEIQKFYDKNGVLIGFKPGKKLCLAKLQRKSEELQLKIDSLKEFIARGRLTMSANFFKRFKLSEMQLDFNILEEKIKLLTSDRDHSQSA